MKNIFIITRKILLAVFVLSGILVLTCASVPKEVVELSYVIGNDISQLQVTYDATINELYNQLREQRLDYLENTWTPKFIKQWMEDGKLVQVAKGELIWSEDEESFVLPTPGQEQNQLLETVTSWSNEAVLRIEEKRKELIEPLNIEEDSLRLMVNEAFTHLINANATVTAHLNSIREVKELQNELFDAVNLKDLCNKINTTLAQASDRAAEGLKKIEEADLGIKVE